MSIAEYIQQDLAVRLRAGHELPAPLTLDSLAEHYQVSFTPVRTAIAGLIEEGLVEKGANRRLAASARQGTRSRKKAPSLPQRPRDPFERIANDLVKLSLDGEPVYLREEATAEKYDISRSAIRNIFHRLAGAGMLDHIPRRGWRLRPFRREDLQAFIEIREVLELKALELARPHLVAADLQRILDGNRFPKSDDEPPAIDNSLHAYIIEKAANEYVKEFFHRQGRYYEILFDWEDEDRATAIETVRQHREILEALLAKDWKGAARALSHHIRTNHPILSRVVPRAERASNGHDTSARRQR
jgi:DNA-binding GntR family transcriptional regulator